MVKRKLGKGLEALFPDPEEFLQEDSQAMEIELKKIHPREDQPRKAFNEKALESLKNSIEEHGVLQPLLLRKKGEDYEIIAGERRYRAAKLAGLKKIPGLVKDLDDESVEVISLIENIQREDLNPIEEAESYDQLMNKYSYTQMEVSKRLGKSRSYIANTLRLLNLDGESRRYLTEGKITSSQARSLLSIEEGPKRKEYLDRLLNKKANVRDLEKAARKKVVKKEDPFKRELEERLLEHFGTKVSIIPKRKGGKIEIEYLSNDDLERILKLMEG